MNPLGIIILGVKIHCEGCANEVAKHLRGFQGVEGIEIDAKNNLVIVKGKSADPTKVRDRLMRKSGKHVKLISPKQPLRKKEEKLQPEEEVNEVVLKIYIHCEGCAEEVKHCILKMEGVQRVEADAGKSRVSVKGSMDPNKLVEFVNNRGGRHAEIVSQTKLHRNKPPPLLSAPRYFCDENPNSCSLM